MKTQILIFLLGGLIAAFAEEPKPPQRPHWPVHPHYQAFLDQNFKFYEFKRLSEEERTVFFSVYRPDLESQKRLEVEGAILGEAPPYSEAKKAFPLHFPSFGRMQSIPGKFLWQQKTNKEGKSGLVFQTESQRYCVDEYHILERLERHGVTQKTGTLDATLSACWYFDQLGGLYLIYVEALELP